MVEGEIFCECEPKEPGMMDHPTIVGYELILDRSVMTLGIFDAEDVS